MSSIAILLLSLGIILVGAEVFTNGIEWLGKKLTLSEGAVGSVLAAVGTALPETMIPFIAFIKGGEEATSIGTGAILGAPMMLATLAMFVTGCAVFIYRGRRSAGTRVTANPEVMKRDLGLFLIVFAAALIAGTMPEAMRKWQLLTAGLMVFSYIMYVWMTFKAERDHDDQELKACYFAPRRSEPPMVMVLVQLAVALGLIVGGAHLFVGGIEIVALAFGVPAFILALVIAPIATELPEKFNSVIWISRGKDTLALGNISGAMVFQSSLIPALGIFMTDWQLTSGGLLTGLLALIAAAILYFQVLRLRRIEAWTLIVSGVFYALFFLMVLQGLIR
ncbi:MAG: sodium:calcium antiporter [Syntrophomonadaceae bacterium]|nr:sodium:calcium antiporter [Syntrophomonadaceae bacterium]